MIVPPPLSDSDAVASDLIFEIDLQVGPVCIKPLPTNSTAFNLRHTSNITIRLK